MMAQDIPDWGLGGEEGRRDQCPMMLSVGALSMDPAPLSHPMSSLSPPGCSGTKVSAHRSSPHTLCQTPLNLHPASLHVCLGPNHCPHAPCTMGPSPSSGGASGLLSTLASEMRLGVLFTLHASPCFFFCPASV